MHASWDRDRVERSFKTAKPIKVVPPRIVIAPNAGWMMNATMT